MSTDRLIEAYKTVLADLEERRTAIDREIEAVKSAMGRASGEPITSGSSVTNGAEPTKIETDTFFGMTVGKAARKYLRMMGKKQHVRDITDALKRGGVKTNEESVSALLRRRADNKGDVVNLGRGEWGLTEWYPSAKRRKTTKQQAEEPETPLGESPTGYGPEGEAATTSADEDVPF